ncbi:acyl-CoA dehydrogenase family protein [Yinghuangia aomiensis]
MPAPDFGLTETQRDIRAMAADFVDTEITPHARAWDRAESVDRGIVLRLGDLGFLGLTIAEEYGGTAADMLQSYVLATEELGRGDSSVRGIVSVSLGLVGQDRRRPRHRRTEERGGFPCSWSAVVPWAASPSPNPAPGPTPDRWPPARSAAAATGRSAAPRCSSPTARGPRSR